MAGTDGPIEVPQIEPGTPLDVITEAAMETGDWAMPACVILEVVERTLSNLDDDAAADFREQFATETRAMAQDIGSDGRLCFSGNRITTL